MPEMTRQMTIARRSFALRPAQVEQSMRGVLPEPLKSHFVVVGRRRYPPKQVLAQVTGLDRAEFTTHHARRILTGLGFAPGRRSPASVAEGAGGSKPTGGHVERLRPSADRLEPFVGQWVATKGPEVLVAAPEPGAVVGWLSEHGQVAESMFRVPADEREASGHAPA